MGEPADAGDDNSAPEDRALVTHEVGPDPGSAMASELGSILPSDLSRAAGESDLFDPVLAAVAAAPSAPKRELELEAGSRVGETFRIERRLGSGGMGVVYLARDESLDRPVAVKLHRAGAGVDRLQREAMAMARLAHPNVITVHEVGRLGDRVFVAMEFVPGGTLRAWLKARPRPWRDALTLCLSAGEGLAAAHDAGLVHRDFKPENVLVGDDGRPRVGDFGLARAIGESSTDLLTSDLTRSGLRTPAPPSSPSNGGSETGTSNAPTAPKAVALEETAPPPSNPSARDAVDPTAETAYDSELDKSHRGVLSDRLTMTGVLVGTPAYMSPEQFAGADVDARADQFAFAVMTWEALHGKRPFAGADQRVLRAAVEAGKIQPPPRDSQVPARVRAVLVRALAVDPGNRWPSMRALLVELRAAARPKRRWPWIVGGGGALLVTAGVAFAAWPREKVEPCKGAIASMDAILAPDTVQRMLDTIDGSPGEQELLDRIRTLLGRVRHNLHDASIASCSAARIERTMPAELEARSGACLAMRARATAMLVDEPGLAKSDPTAYLTRLRAVPSLVPCLDPVALAASVELRNDEAAIMARARLWAASADVRAHRYEEAQAEAKEALELALPDDRGVRALATLVDGQVAYAKDRLPEAQRLFTDAYYAGVALDDTDVYLGALRQLIQLHATDRFEMSAAEPWIRAGAAAVEKDRRRAAGEVIELLGALVGAADNRGDSEQAIAFAEEMLKMVPPGADAGIRGEAELALADALVGGGQYDEAIKRYQGAIEEYVTALGPTHPTTAEVLTDYGMLLIDAGKFEQVPPIIERARIALAAWPNARSTDRATALLNLGVLLTDDPKDFAEAERAYTEARSVFAAVLGPEHPDVALADANLAVLENKRGRHIEALAALDRAIAIQEKALGPGHFQVAATSYNIAAAALLAKNFERAEPAAARAEAYFAQHAEGSLRHLYAMNLHARALSGQGHHAAALALAERVLSMAGNDEDSGEAVVGAAVEIARALIALHRDPDRANALLDQAYVEYSKFPEAYARLLREIDALRAELQKR
ncbi:MAG TPA: serine/threonine-protein kinase [Kofleriaceae bacterium]|nr:serine/threonine-protein kinase [Kofleriaceae bacterium]